MVNNIIIGKNYWFINKIGIIGECKIKRYVPATSTSVEYWQGDCLNTMGTRGFTKEMLYENQSQAKIAYIEKRKQEVIEFEKQINTPDKLLQTMFDSFHEYHSDKECNCVKEKIKEYFNITL